MNYQTKVLISFCSDLNGWKIPFQHANRNSIPLCSTMEQILGCSGRFGWFRAIPAEIMDSVGMSFMWKKLTDYKEKSYEPRWGGEKKGRRRRRWEEKNQEKLRVMRFIIYVRFLLKSLEKMGFNNKWISLMMQCISTVSYSVLINRVIHGSIIPTRGLHQGDPLAPYLFLLDAEGLTSLIVE